MELVIKLSIPYFFFFFLVVMALLNKEVMEYIIKISRHRYNYLLNHYPLLPINLYAHRKLVNPYGDTLFTNCSYTMDIHSLKDYYLYFNFTPKSKTRLQFRCCRNYHSMGMDQEYDLLKTFKTDRGLVLRTYPMSRLDVNRIANQNEFKLLLETDYQIILVIKNRMIHQLCINQTNITFKNDLPIQRLAIISNHITLKMMESNILL